MWSTVPLLVWTLVIVFLGICEQALLLPVLLLLPLLGAFCLWVLPVHTYREQRLVALTVTLLELLAAVRLWASYAAASADVYRLPFQHVLEMGVQWHGVWWVRLHFGVDGLGLSMVLLTAFLMPIAVLCSWQLLSPPTGSQTRGGVYFGLLLLLEAGLVGAFSCLDLLGFYVVYETVLLPMFLLVGLGGSRARKVRAAFLLVLYTLLGSLLLLPALVLVFLGTGSTGYEVLLHHAFCGSWGTELQCLLFWGLFLAFAVKVPVMPVHLWLPEAHVEASTAGSVLLAGVLLKLGIYGLVRFSLPLLPAACAYYCPVVVVLGLVSVLCASLATLRQVDLKKVVAYSSVAHMNLVVVAVFCGGLGLVAGSYQMLAHGVVSPALFLLVGGLYDRYHTKALKYLGGGASLTPLFSLFLLVFSLGNMALPLTPGFAGEFLMLCAVLQVSWAALLICCGGVVLSAAYSMWAYARVVHGLPKLCYTQAAADLGRREFCCLALLLTLTLWLGMKPQPILNLLSACLLWCVPVSDGGEAATQWLSG